MNRKVLFAVRLYDDLTGMLLKGPQFLFYIDGIIENCIRKVDGYFVFLDKGKRRLLLKVKAEGYETQEVSIDVSNLEPMQPEIEIRLMQKRIGGDIGKRALEGKIEAGFKELWLFPKNKKALIKYGGTLKEQPDVMKINLMTPTSIINLNLGCLDEENGEFDIFRAKYKLEHNVYRLDKQLHKKYVMGSEIVRVYHTITKEDGNYHFYLDDFYDTASFLLIYEDKGKLQKIELHI